MVIKRQPCRNLGSTSKSATPIENNITPTLMNDLKLYFINCTILDDFEVAFLNKSTLHLFFLL